ncbi:DNA uptake protein related DNA-binding protein [Levilactobacillus paucivorans]|uniref:DNA uptake protein related DNA-binding protein n=1 Tax=Levilactobacillus paucivorans TaxID=616990 RepID=A0A0R2LTD4_9LACO|nr:ComEA family DNA-binding protein [Levilactobacillus paucivorans]KRO04933.1 DNA uptake protein related DNA-binding protein [Levilactobacillus paucivorans]
MEQLMMWWQELSLRTRMVMAGCLAVMVLLLVGWGLLHRSPVAALPAKIPPATQAMSASGSHKVATETGSQASSSHDTRVFVDVQGAVRKPGLYQFGPEMRVADAIQTAGGLAPRADRQQINLATRLTDQQKLYIPLKGEKVPQVATSGTSAGGTSDSQGSGGPTTVVNLNTATVADLQRLTGIGEKKAQKIVAYREEHGSFKSVKDLAQVPGFGDKTVANLQDQLTT